MKKEIPNKMKSLISLAIVLILLSTSPQIIGQSQSLENILPKEVRETSITACWIEYPLHKVLSDLKGVQSGLLNLDASICSTDLDTPITLEVIDVGFEQVLKEILLPNSLDYEIKNSKVIIRPLPRSDEKQAETLVFFTKWQILNQVPLPTGMQLPNQSKKRHDHIYLNGRVDELESPPDFAKNKKIHRWISSRPQIIITKHVKSQLIKNYRCVPVVELVTQ
jgi:hypothetical protein